MTNYKGLKNACSETKQLDRLLGFETQIAYDPTEQTIYAETNTAGTQIVYRAPIVTLGFVKYPMSMSELSAWIDERIADRNAEDRWC